MCTVGAAPRSSGQEAHDGWHDLGQRQHVDEPSNASQSGDELLKGNVVTFQFWKHSV